MRGRLAGRVAIITGGGHGIGRAYVRRFAEEGASVVIAELDGLAAETVTEVLRRGGRQVLAVPTDVADEHSVAEMGRGEGGLRPYRYTGQQRRHVRHRAYVAGAVR